MITSPTLLGRALVWSLQSYQRLLETVSVFQGLPTTCCTRNPWKKCGLNEYIKYVRTRPNSLIFKIWWTFLRTEMCRCYTLRFAYATHWDVSMLHIEMCQCYTLRCVNVTHWDVPMLHTEMCQCYTLRCVNVTHWNVSMLHTEMCQCNTLRCANATHGDVPMLPKLTKPWKYFNRSETIRIICNTVTKINDILL